MKKLRASQQQLEDEISKTKEWNQRIQRDNETLRINNKELSQAAQRLTEVEYEAAQLRGEIAEALSNIKLLKNAEKQTQKELTVKQVELMELAAVHEEQHHQLVFTRTERDQAVIQIEKVQTQFREVEGKLGETQSAKGQTAVQVAALEASIVELNAKHAKELEKSRKDVDQMRYDMRGLEKQRVTLRAERTKLKSDLQTSEKTVRKLEKSKRNLELDLDDSMQEIKICEEELTAMQRFIRDQSK